MLTYTDITLSVVTIETSILLLYRQHCYCYIYTDVTLIAVPKKRYNKKQKQNKQKHASLLLAVYLAQITLTVVPLHKPPALLTSLVLMYLYRCHSYCCAYTDIILTVVPLYKPFALSYLYRYHSYCCTYTHHSYCCTYTHHSYCCTSTDITRTVVPKHTSQLLLHLCRTVLPQ